MSHDIPSEPANPRTWLTLTPFLLIPSGCAALIYQVIWVRLLGLSIGSTSAAVSIVLAAFFLGITLGSILSTRIAKGTLTDLKTFAWLELAIGIGGLLLLPALLNLDHVMAALGEAGSSLTLKFVISLLLLLIPTACMGATYPVLASALVHQQAKLGASLSNLYTLNTAGAVAGALLSGFVLVPAWGLDGSVKVAFVFNALAGLAALGLYRKLKATSPGAALTTTNQHTDIQTTQDSHDSQHILAGCVLFFTGFIAIASEVAWTKYLSIFVGATLYGFSAILGIFLIGIASGSWFTKKHLTENRTNHATVAWALAVMAIALLLARVGLAQLPALLEPISQMDQFQQSTKYLVAFAILFPATFTFGALFPITLSLYCERVTDLNRRVGRGYAINTLGSILGSLAAGFWLIPTVGTDTLLTLSIFGTAILAWCCILHVSQYRALLNTGLTLVILGAWLLPHLDYRQLIASNPYRFDTDAMSGKTPEFLYLEEGKAGVISLVAYDEDRAKLQNNGIQESFIPLTDKLSPPFTEMLLGIMPYLLHENPKTAFAVGFGGGNTLQALAATPLEKIRVVELEPAIVSAVEVAYQGTIPMLEDPRVTLAFNDARNSLLVDAQSYDLIVSQPSHPWLSGAGNLFTREFFEIAATHLNEGGIFAQWVNLFNMDVTTLKSILKAYFSVFPHGFTVANTDAGDLLIFGSHQPITMNQRVMANRMRLPAIQKALATASVSRPEHLLWYFSMSRDEALAISEDVAANTDTRIVSEVRLAGLNVDPQGDENPYRLLKEHYNFDVLEYLTDQDAARTIYLAGRYFFQHYSTTRTRKALETLQQLNPPLANRLEHDWEAWKDRLRR